MLQMLWWLCQYQLLLRKNKWLSSEMVLLFLLKLETTLIMIFLLSGLVILDLFYCWEILSLVCEIVFLYPAFFIVFLAGFFLIETLRFPHSKVVMFQHVIALSRDTRRKCFGCDRKLCCSVAAFTCWVSGLKLRGAQTCRPEGDDERGTLPGTLWEPGAVWTCLRRQQRVFRRS